VLVETGDVTEVLDFDDAKTNFLAAAQRGLGAQFTWTDGRTVPARELILDRLLPLAEEGLRRGGIDDRDAKTYLGVIAARVEAEMTGANWALKSLGRMKDTSQGERMHALAAAMLRHQRAGTPVHEWAAATLDDAGGWQKNYRRVEQYMTTDVFTVHEDETIDLVACLMDWAHIRHVPVENEAGELAGLVSYRSLLRALAEDRVRREGIPIAVREIMQRSPITIPPERTTLEAIEIMRRERVACLPVVDNHRLVGIVTEHDFVNVARELLEERLRSS